MQKGTSSINLFSSGIGLPSPWIVFSLPKYFLPNKSSHWETHYSEFNPCSAIALELKILLNSPQANWSLLLKILLMRNAKLSSIIFHHLIQHLPTADCFIPSLDQPFMNQKKYASKCEGFMCGKECNKISEWISEQNGKFYYY